MLPLNGDRTAEAGRKLAPKLEVLISLVQTVKKFVFFSWGLAIPTPLEETKPVDGLFITGRNKESIAFC